jgi:transcriptional regulator with XRE-family HTH domain
MISYCPLRGAGCPGFRPEDGLLLLMVNTSVLNKAAKQGVRRNEQFSVRRLIIASSQQTVKGDEGKTVRHGELLVEGCKMSDKNDLNLDRTLPAQTMGSRIRMLRDQKQISLSLLADKAGISKAYLHELENDKAAKPSAEILYNIALSLDTTVGYLLGRRPANSMDQGDATPIVIPEALEQFAREARITEEDKRNLASIKFRNKQPKTSDDWRFLYDTIKRVIVPES